MVRLYKKLLEYGVTMHVESIPDTRTLIFTFEKSGWININKVDINALTKKSRLYRRLIDRIR